MQSVRVGRDCLRSLMLIVLVGPIWAQPEVAQELDGVNEEEVIEVVEITGSRVRRSNLDAPSPVLVIDSATLVSAGITTLGEFARYLPQNADTLSDSQSGTSGLIGAAAFNLRGIGLDGTLTMVNGRRIAPFGGSGDFAPFVDINAIPVAAIERIEVLKDGASAIYGSEAVAGVVNIILKRSVEKPVFEAGYLSTSEGDGDEKDASLAAGWNNGSTRLVGTLSWYERDEIWSRDRKFASDADLSAVGGNNGRSPRSSPPTIRLPTAQVADPACPEHSLEASRLEIIAPNGTIQVQCRFNFAAFTTMQQPSERWAGTAAMHHVFGNGVAAFAEAIVSRNETQTVLAPTPLVNYLVLADHPDNPFQQNLRIQYRLLDAGDRGFDVTSSTWRVVAGLEGEAGDWEWQAAAASSEAETDSQRFNGVLGEQFANALLGFGGPDGDQYYNPFGLHPQNPREVLDKILISGTGTVLTSTETSVDAQASTHFGALSGGPVGVAFGAQWRQIELDQLADPEELSGVIEGGQGLLPLNQDRTIGSAFVEFVLPVLSSLEAQLALRYDDYDDFGSTTNPKIGLGWRPWDEFLVRATWGTSFRPPTFRELYDPVFESEGFLAEDPWRCPVTGSFEDCVGQALPNVSSGNPGLEPDEGETRLLGFAWEPGSLAGLTLAVEIWEIEHTNRILYTSGIEGLFQVMLEELDPDANPLVQRAPPSAEDLALGIPGPVIGMRDTYFNAGKVDTKGVDFSASYQWTTDRAGGFRVNFDFTRLDEYFVGISQFGVEYLADWAGAYGESSALPQDRGNLGLNWNFGVHGATANMRYSGSYYSPIPLILNGADTGRQFEVDAYTQLDLQYSYQFDTLRGATLRLGCQNCTDEDPPVYNYSNSAEPFHEGRGLMFYLRWSQPF